MVSQAATEEDSVYRLYYDFSQSLSRLQTVDFIKNRNFFYVLLYYFII